MNSGLSRAANPTRLVYTVGSGAVLASRPVSWAKSVATLSSHHGNVVIVKIDEELGSLFDWPVYENIFVILDDLYFDKLQKLEFTMVRVA